MGEFIKKREIRELNGILEMLVDPILVIDETYRFLYPESQPLISFIDNKNVKHLTIHSGDKFAFWDQFNLAWGIGSPDLIKILTMYQQSMVFCPPTPQVHAMSYLFKYFLESSNNYMNYCSQIE